MGICASKLSRQERQLVRAAEFVRFASQGDLKNLLLMLKKRRIDVNAKDRFGMTALHWASYAGKLACVQELIKAGASPSAVDGNGRSALHHACRKDQDDIVRFLLDTAKMDIHARSENKDTPLHKAVRGKCVKTVVVLLKYGADPNLRNDQNRTPLEELDVAVSSVTDKMPTARTDAEYTAWHQPPTEATESGSGGLFVALRRRSTGGGIFSSKKSGRRSTSGGGEVTLVRRFLSHRSSLSEHSDSGSSRVSISGMWATNAEAMQSRTASMGPLQPVNPIDLAMMHAGNGRVAACDSFTSSSFASSVASLPGDVGSGSHHNMEASGHHEMLRRKSLKYAGKRVIMALRVKKNLPGDEKSQMIRLMLEKYMSGENRTGEESPLGQHALGNPARRNSFTHQVSGFTVSLAPDM